MDRHTETHTNKVLELVSKLVVHSSQITFLTFTNNNNSYALTVRITTRQHTDLHLHRQRLRTTFSSKLPKHHFTILWNAIDVTLRRESRRTEFMYMLSKRYVDNYKLLNVQILDAYSVVTMLKQLNFKHKIHTSEHPTTCFINTVYQMMKLPTASIYSISRMFVLAPYRWKYISHL